MFKDVNLEQDKERKTIYRINGDLLNDPILIPLHLFDNYIGGCKGGVNGLLQGFNT